MSESGNGSSSITPPTNRQQPSETSNETSNESNSTSNVTEMGDNNNASNEFPDINVCCITGEPPTDGVRFIVPDENGVISDQVFEYTALHRHVATHGYFEAFRDVKHPITRASVSRNIAASYIRRVPPSLQRLINDERQRLGLPLDVLTPSGEDTSNFRMMLRRLGDSRQHEWEYLGPDTDESTPHPWAEYGYVLPTQDGTAGTADADDVEILEIPHPLVEEDDDDTPSPRAPSGVRNVRRRLDPSLPAAAIAPDARASLPAAAIAPNARGTRIQLGGFVNRAGTEIRSPEHAAGLIGILQLAKRFG